MKAPFRKRKNAVLAALSDGIAPALRVASRSLTGPSTPPGSWRNGILLGASHIGDVLYRSSSLPALHEGLPDCKWDYLAEPPATEILAGNPYISRVLTPDELFKVKEKWDVAICYDTGSYHRFLSLAVKLRIPNRIGYTHKGFSGLVTQPIPIQWPQAYPAYFRELVAGLVGKSGSWPLRPLVYTSEEDEIEVSEFLETFKIKWDGLILPAFLTTRQLSGVWPAEKLAETLKVLEMAHPDLQTILLGSSGDKALLELLAKRFSLRAPVAAGKLKLRPLVSLLKRCRAVLTTDSGPRHLANAANVTPCFFRNISFNRVESGRYLENEVDFAPPEADTVPAAQQEAFFKRVEPSEAASLVTSKCFTS